MEALNIQGTIKTPAIFTDHNRGIIEIKGRSSPENSSNFYKPLMTWIDNYINNPQKKTLININLDHFNTSSSKCFLDIFRKLEALREKGKEVMINWYYESTDAGMREAGESYEGMVDIPFQFIDY